jgi:hypothetical protein
VAAAVAVVVTVLNFVDPLNLILVIVVLDLILLHTDYLRKQPKSRIEDATKKYNIQKDFTNLFFFELKDEIFLTSSTDTDYYKLIK